MAQSDFDRGVAAERERIRSIFSHDLAAELPGDAIRLALESDLDPIVAGFRLRRESALPESERHGAEILERERTGASTLSHTSSTSTGDTSDPHGWRAIADKLNAEAGAKQTPATKQSGAYSVDELVDKMNAEA